MPVYSGTVDGETIRSFPELSYNERVVEVEYFYHYGQHMNPFEPNPFQYNFYRITTEYIDIMQRKDSTFYYGRLNDHKIIIDGRTLSRDYNIRNPSLSTQPMVDVFSIKEQSRRDGSLPSKSKTRGNLKSSSKKFLPGTTPYAYKPKSDERCRKGYKSELIMGRRMCVKID